MIFDDYSFIYFICEGTNEEEVLNWTIREDALNIDKENYSTDWSRVKGSKGKEKLIDEILTINHEEKDKNKVAVLFIHDRKTDEWLNKSEIKKFSKYADIITIKTKEDFSKAQELCRAHQMLNLDIIFINTAPEIELLLLIKKGYLNGSTLVKSKLLAYSGKVVSQFLICLSRLLSFSRCSFVYPASKQWK